MAMCASISLSFLFFLCQWHTCMLQLNAISKFCARHPELKGMKSNSTHMSNLYRHLLHVDAYKLLYCFVPKGEY